MSTTSSTGPVAQSIADTANKFDSSINSLPKGLSITVIVLMVFWIATGFVATFMSIVCMGAPGTGMQKFFGFIIALLLGPFYWFYFLFDKTYCTRCYTAPVTFVGKPI